MVENIVTKPLGLVLIITAHMIFNVQSRAEVTGIAGTNITLEFIFNVTLTEKSHFAVYFNKTKIAEYLKGAEGDVSVKNTSVFWCITNLKAYHSGKYYASEFMNGFGQESSSVQLNVQDEPRSSTGPPMHSTPSTTPEDSGSSYVIFILVVSPVVLLVAVLPCLIWCLVRSRDKQQEPPPPQSSYPTVQETEAYKNVHGPSLVYSVLDFPKRPSAVMEINPNDTEYAAVSYLPENRRV
ncbi:uncharacterized protein LOC104920403 [Larimichthys crocea]|uniref:uncharacterized protein LOC104920403 n=1 Tax=Larimichthys crocea TaxID=215358 RepID=UPI000622D4FB|nr:uncharacterized protein LOC104920403 [Larimichthys crocea]